MGMVINGQWSDEDNVIKKGAYQRQSSANDGDIDPDIIAAMKNEPGRFYLIASKSCQWSHRTVIARALRGLEQYIPLHFAHGPRHQGYAVNGGKSWPVPGTNREIVHLHELYSTSDPEYTGRSTVPVLWDAKTARIVSNESKRIFRALNALPAKNGVTDFTLIPPRLEAKIETENQLTYEGLCNGVYKAGFARSQSAYDVAVTKIFETLDYLEDKLASRRFLHGNVITESDCFLFPTLGSRLNQNMQFCFPGMA